MFGEIATRIVANEHPQQPRRMTLDWPRNVDHGLCDLCQYGLSFHDAVAVQCVGGDPPGHQHHRHPRPWMSGTPSEVQSRYVRAAIGRLERTAEATVTRQSVDRA